MLEPGNKIIIPGVLVLRHKLLVNIGVVGSFQLTNGVLVPHLLVLDADHPPVTVGETVLELALVEVQTRLGSDIVQVHEPDSVRFLLVELPLVEGLVVPNFLAGLETDNHERVAIDFLETLGTLSAFLVVDYEVWCFPIVSLELVDHFPDRVFTPEEFPVTLKHQNVVLSLSIYFVLQIVAKIWIMVQRYHVAYEINIAIVRQVPLHDEVLEVCLSVLLHHLLEIVQLFVLELHHPEQSRIFLAERVQCFHPS